MRVYFGNTQMTSKHGKNKEVQNKAQGLKYSVAWVMTSYHILMSSVP